MKLNVKKLQEGGGMPFMVYQPTPSSNRSSETSKAESSTKEKDSKKSESESESFQLLSKEVINELIKKGLPNDVNSFLKDLQTAESFTMDGSFDRNKLYSLASKANLLINNSALMDSAMKEAYSNDGLEELAIGTRGQLFVQDKNGNIKQISMPEYNKKRDQFSAMTVNDLSKARMYNPNLAFDTEVISTIQNSMGINKINDYMLGILNKLGTETLSKEGYVDKQKLKETIGAMTNGKNPTESELKGIQELASTYQSMGKDGIYKITQEKSTQRNHISDGFEYLWAMLPNNARNVLKARYVVDGNESSNPANIIRNSFYMFTNESSKNTLDYPTNMNEEESGSGDGNSGLKDKQFTQSPLEKLTMGSLDIIDDFVISNPSDSSQYNVGIKLKGSKVNVIPDLNNNPVSATTLTNVMKSGLSIIGNKSKIFFGNKQLKDFDLNNIVYDGGEVINTMVPVDRNGKPDLEMLNSYNNALEEFKTKNITNPQEKNKILAEKYGLDHIKFDSSGQLSPISKGYLKPFLVFHGFTTDDTNLTDGNNFTDKISSEDQDQYETWMGDIYKNLKLTMPNVSMSIFGGGIYKAPIFIAMSDTAQNDITHFVGHGAQVQANSTAESIIKQRTNKPVYAGSEIL